MAPSLGMLALRGPCRRAATHLFACSGCSGTAKSGAGGTQKAKQKEGRKKKKTEKLVEIFPFSVLHQIPGLSFQVQF